MTENEWLTCEDDRPWKQPGAVRRDCEPHRGQWFALLAGVNAAAIALPGVPSALLYLCITLRLPISPGDLLLVLPGALCLPLGVITWALTERELARIGAGDTDRAGLTATTWAYRFGIATMTVGAPFALFAVLCLVVR